MTVSFIFFACDTIGENRIFCVVEWKDTEREQGTADPIRTGKTAHIIYPQNWLIYVNESAYKKWKRLMQNKNDT